MPTVEREIPFVVGPGINRDSSNFSGQSCIDGQWCRFYYGKPRKMGGYKTINITFSDIPRGASVVSQSGLNYYYIGTPNNCYTFPINSSGTGTSLIDRTPAAFGASANNVWQYDNMFDVGSSKKLIFAHAGQNLAAIDSTVQTPVYYGDATATTPLVTIAQSVSGGVCCIHPYVVLYGNDGFIIWAGAGTINFGGGDAGSARITGSKIIKGVSIRGGAGFSPAGLFWSLDNLNRIYFVGGASVFANESVGETYLLSSSAVVEDNGLFYWPSADGKFCYWNGGINTLPNSFNQRFFFENLLPQNRQKVCGFRNAAFDEICWLFCNGNVTENNWMLVYNKQSGVWYDTPLTRGCGISGKVFPYPVLFDSVPNNSGVYRMWQHEYGGYDEIDGTTTNAIKSYFESQVFTLIDQAIDSDFWTFLEWFEPDFTQVGNLQLEVRGTTYPQSSDASNETSGVFTIPKTSAKLDIKEQRRLLTLRVTSNEQGGFYYMGKPLMKITEGNGRQWQS